MATILLNQTLRRPSMASAHEVDILSLVVAGLLLGIALSQAVVVFRKREQR